MLAPASRLLVLLNPGRTSRHYLLGLAAAARKLGVLAGTLELGPVWAMVQGAGPRAPEARAEGARQARNFVERAGVTHVLGYVHNGVFDFGLHPEPGTGRPVSAFAAEGCRHLLLWTDHPNWAMNGTALEPPAREFLAHPAYTHIVKSPAAAGELRERCGWHSVHALAPGEDYATLRPAQGIVPAHDAALIMSDAAPPPEPVRRFLDEADPDPLALMEAMRPAAERAWGRFLDAQGVRAESRQSCVDLAAAWLDAKMGAPQEAFARAAQTLGACHQEALAWLGGEPRRWYAGVASLNAVTAWRRFFWPAWLARRADVGLFGSAPGAMDAPAPAGAPADHWVSYERQADVYARGRVAININAAHDEEGLTHKPFQIAAAGVACVHHDSAGLRDHFGVEEMRSFSRGPELLDAVRSLVADAGARRRLADAALGRAMRDHSWEARLLAMLALPQPATEDAGVQSAA